MKTRRVVILSLALLSLASGSAHSGGPLKGSSGSTDAARLERSAAAAEEAMQYRRMTELRVQALEVDPRNIESHLNLMGAYYQPTLLPDLQARVLTAVGVLPDRQAAECFRLMWQWAVPALADGASAISPLARACHDVRRAIHDPATGVRVMARYPDSKYAQQNRLFALATLEEWNELKAVATQLTRAESPSMRAFAAGFLSVALHAQGKHAQAFAVEAEWRERMRRASSGVRLNYLYALSTHWTTSVSASTDLTAAGDHFQRVKAEVRREIRALAWESDLEGRFRLLSLTAQNLLDDGELHSALQVWDQATAAADSLDVPLLQSMSRARRGRTLVKLGRPAAEAELLSARALALRASDRQWLMETSHDLLHLYEAEQRIPQAKQAGADFVAYADGISGALEMMSHRDLAWLYRRSGDSESARLHFSAMVRKIDEIDDEHFYAGEYFESIGELDEARRRFRRSMDNRPTYYRALAALARVWETLGETDSALIYARRHDASLATRFPEYTPILPGLLARSGQPAAAMRALQQARAESARHGPAHQAQLTLDLAELVLNARQNQRAAILADSAAAAAASVSALEIELRARAIAALARIRDGDTARVADAESVHDRARAMDAPAFLSAMKQLLGDARVAAGDGPGGLSAYGDAAALIEAVTGSLATDADRAGLRAAQVSISNRALALLLDWPDRRERIELFAKWSVERKAREILGFMPSLNVRELRAAIPASTAVIDYLVLDSGAVALVFTRDAAEVIILPTSPNALRSAARDLRVQLDTRVGTMIDTTRTYFDLELSHRLYAQLVAPLEPLIRGQDRLIIVADGVLHELPFDALVTRLPATKGDYRTARYLMDQVTVLHAPSLSAITYRPESTHASTLLFAAADARDRMRRPLGADREISMMRALLEDVPAELQVAASERQVRKLARDARIIHFAAHAIPNDVDPAHARLTLTPDGDDDGLLHAYEIAEMRLNAELVVLSACETAAGRIRGGEGALSLSRSFLRAGARSTVATLWPVGEPTAALMEVFYRRLAQGAGSATALRDARLALRSGDYAHPFFWAPFTLLTITPTIN